MSYRRGWQLLASLDASFREPVVVIATGGGGGARVTPFGRELITCYRAFERYAEARTIRAFKGIAKKARSGARSARAVPVVRLGGRPGPLASRYRYVPGRDTASKRR
jgi:molybdate transport repressor ModE-like protein